MTESQRRNNYYIQHNSCPICGEMQFDKRFGLCIFPDNEDIKDLDIKTCLCCGWVGETHKLVKMNQLKYSVTCGGYMDAPTVIFTSNDYDVANKVLEEKLKESLYIDDLSYYLEENKL